MPAIVESRASLAGSAILTAGAVTVIAGSAMPWLRSGSRERNSYQLYTVLRHLDATDDLLSRLVLRTWPLVPLGLTVAVVLAWAGWRLAAAIVAVVAASEVVIACAAARRSPLDSLSGVVVTFVGALVVILGAMLLLTRGRRTTRST